jgi:hypothetical protein
MDHLRADIQLLENYFSVATKLLENIQGQHRQAVANFSKDKKQLEKETNIWHSFLVVD